MKIERISDTQIKFILNKTDLKEKNIKITELAYGSEKTQELFREMMEQAYNEYGFEAENTPLMIEAIPVAMDSIMIIVTKVANGDDIESKFNNFLPKPKDYNRFRSKDSSLDNYPGEHFDKPSAAPMAKPPAHGTRRPKPPKVNVYIYSFKQMDDAINLCARLLDVFGDSNGCDGYDGLSSMYKYNGEYFMVFDNRACAMKVQGFEDILNEYGKKHVSGVITKYHLMEHAETMIAESAVQRLARI